MRSVVQNLWNGEVTLLDQPVPSLSAGHVLIRTTRSLISAGTERMLVEFGKSNLLQKAMSQPEKVRQVLDKVKTAGVGAAWTSVNAKMDEPLAIGYCNAGVVVSVAPDVTEFQAGDRVVSNGGHAEYVVVPRTLCARIPDDVPDEEAAFTPLAAISLQGVRLIAPALGERVGVIGLGLVGMLAAQLLRNSGCQVIGFDFNRERLALSHTFGVETVDLESTGDPVARAMQYSDGRGLDAVVIATSTTSMGPITQAAEMCRPRGRIVLIGVCGLELNRNQFFKKELTFQVSSSYGPGRYDADYEQRAHDYPFGFVRWTAQRNFEAVLASMSGRRLDVRPLITDRLSHAEVESAYARLLERDSLGIVMEYSADAPAATRVQLREGAHAVVRGTGRVVRAGFIGAGAFTRAVLLPSLKAAGVELRGIASRNGLSAAHVGRKFEFGFCASNVDAVIDDPDTDAIFITTPHDTHAALVRKALGAGKHVFVEKPLCISDAQLEDVRAAYAEFAIPAGLQLMVGFNRRFASLSQALSSQLATVKSPKAMVFTVNAGSIAAGHWVMNNAVSGGRIVGEGVHFIDLLAFLAGSPVAAVQASSAGDPDQMTLTLRHADGSIGTVHYFTSGHRSFPKEQVTVFAEGTVYVLDNFRTLRAHGARARGSKRLWNQDKGHGAELDAFVRSVRDGGAAAIPFDAIVNATRASFAAVRAARSGELEPVPTG